MTTFRNLRVWQEARLMAHDAHDVADMLPRTVAFLSDQMRRASSAVHRNIAEGAGKDSEREFRRYLEISRSSLHETEAIAAEIRGRYAGHVKRAALDAVDRRALHTGRLLTALIDSLGPK